MRWCIRSHPVPITLSSAAERNRRMKKLITPDDNGDFETELSLESGGNYIMVLYEEFTGAVELGSAYDKNGGNKL